MSIAKITYPSGLVESGTDIYCTSLTANSINAPVSETTGAYGIEWNPAIPVSTGIIKKTWAEIVAIVPLVNGLINIGVNSTGAPCIIDSSLDCGGKVIFEALYDVKSAKMTLTINDSATLINPNTFSGNLQVNCDSKTTHSISINDRILYLTKGCSISLTATALVPAISIADGKSSVILCEYNAVLSNTLAPAVSVVNVGIASSFGLTISRCLPQISGTWPANIISSTDGTGTFAYQIDFSILDSKLTSQSGFTGTIISSPIMTAAKIPFDDSKNSVGLTLGTNLDTALNSVKIKIGCDSVNYNALPCYNLTIPTTGQYNLMYSVKKPMESKVPLTTGNYNSIFNRSGGNLQSGNYNLSFDSSMNALTSGSYNFCAQESGDNLTGNFNILLGRSGRRLTSGSNNTILNQGITSSTGSTQTFSHCIAIGEKSMDSIISSNDVISLGRSSLETAVNADNCISIGANSLSSIVDGAQNLISIGVNSLTSYAPAQADFDSSIVSIGHNSLSLFNSAVRGCVSIGQDALKNWTGAGLLTGDYPMMVIGSNSCENISALSKGSCVLGFNSVPSGLIVDSYCMGSQVSGAGNLTSMQDTALFGTNVGYNLTSATDCTVFGCRSGNNMTTGLRNVIFGSANCPNLQSGNHNAVMGWNNNIYTSSSYNFLAGMSNVVASASNSATSDVVIGRDNKIRSNTTDATNNDIVIGNSNDLLNFGSTTSASISSVIGYNNFSENGYSVCLGSENNLYRGNYNHVLGYNNQIGNDTISCSKNVLIGDELKIDNITSTHATSENILIGSSSTITNVGNNTSGNKNIQIGLNNTMSGYRTINIGYNNIITNPVENTICLGYNLTAGESNAVYTPINSLSIPNPNPGSGVSNNIVLSVNPTSGKIGPITKISGATIGNTAQLVAALQLIGILSA
jgi:hypothetical protein